MFCLHRGSHLLPISKKPEKASRRSCAPPASVSGWAGGLLWPMDREQTWAKLYPRGSFQVHRLVQPLILFCLWEERLFPNKDGSFHLGPSWEGRHRAEPRHVWSEIEMLFAGNWWDFRIVCFHRKADNHTSQRCCLESVSALSLSPPLLSLTHTHSHTHTHFPPGYPKNYILLTHRYREQTSGYQLGKEGREIVGTRVGDKLLGVR